MKLVEGTVRITDLGEFLEAIGEIQTDTGATVQVFDARYVVDRDHLERAVELADRAIERGENVARERAVEILLYAAGRRQIDEALEMGVDEGESSVVALVDGGDEPVAAERVAEIIDESAVLGKYDEERVAAFFDVTAAEREATAGTLASIVRERAALLEVEK
ncbi:KEOPS complex subunit Cgi121 [Haloferacaceae archaeon DSL9]